MENRGGSAEWQQRACIVWQQNVLDESLRRIYYSRRSERDRRHFLVNLSCRVGRHVKQIVFSRGGVDGDCCYNVPARDKYVLRVVWQSVSLLVEPTWQVRLRCRAQFISMRKYDKAMQANLNMQAVRPH